MTLIFHSSEVICCCPSGFRPAVLGDDHPCPTHGLTGRAAHRRPCSWHHLQLRVELPHLHLVPIRRFHGHIPPSHFTCIEVRFTRRVGCYAHPIRFVFARGDMEDVVVDDSMGMMGGDGGLGMPTDVSRRSIGMLLPRLPKRGFEVRSWTTMVSSTNGDSTTTMQSEFSMSSTHDWISFLLMTLGIFSSFAYLSSQLIAIFKVGSSSSRLSSASYARNGGRIPLGNLPIPPRPRQRRRSLRNCKLENTCAPCSG